MRCPRCPRISGTTPSTTRSPACCPPSAATPSTASNILATLVRHPKLTQVVPALQQPPAVQLDAAPRLRELAILRVAIGTDSKYEWRHHVTDGPARSASPTT